METVLSALRSAPVYQQLLGALQDRARIRALRLPRAARLPLAVALHQDTRRSIILLTDRADHAATLWQELGVWTGARRHLFSEPNPLFYERAAWTNVTRMERIQTLTSLISDRLPPDPVPRGPSLVVSSARALMTRTIPPQEFLTAFLHLGVGAFARPDTTRRHLMAAGYERVNTVLEPGQLASRCGLLDMWPPVEPFPIRLEFFADSIEAIRRFDPASQRTIESLDRVSACPAREFIVPVSEPVFPSNAASEAPGEFQIPLIHAEPASLLDYAGASALILVDDHAALGGTAEEIEEQAVQLRRAAIAEGSLPEDFPLPYVTWSELRDQLDSLSTLGLGQDDSEAAQEGGAQLDFSALFSHDERFGGRLKPVINYIRALAIRGDRVVVASRQHSRLQELWQETSDASGGEKGSATRQPPRFLESSLREGFVLGDLHLMTDSEIFGWERVQPRARARSAAETPESTYADLRPGDPIVHIDHGVGRYLGLVQRDLDGVSREYLALEYDSGGQLFVPVYQADRLTRYVGADSVDPALDRLGGQEWHEKKGRAKEAVLQVAREMLELHASREVAKGFAFGADSVWQAELEESFPYVETEDQTRALREIKEDMERPRPMDRLLCGDVGYGKTELALRAAFKAVMGGKQAAVLVPTTVLAQQHYETFLERLTAFPVKVEMLSRFRSPREQGEIIEALVRGEVDIVIGTHRLLSGDVQFKDLGLVIIDEEQRFGVSHKEHLKRLRTEVDVLTLTATPIPRTLYMALTGVRDISNLNTPPDERLPIITHVGPYSSTLARQAILRELERGGQIFFVHNRVHTIDAMRMHLAQLVPEARVDVGHGQMPEHQLADVMHRFNRGDTDILLSTTIIESGLDIPNANTLIVDRADTLGLSELYQLRGRVGRGAARAYAYFFRHRRLAPTIDSQQRLDVIAENTELGSGYSIAMRDLEIRGAGELLGTRQHGHIQAVGFHLYTRLLADSVRQIRLAWAARGQEPAGSAGASEWEQRTPPVAMPVTVDLPLNAGIPASYIADGDLRLRLYRRIADLRDEAELDALASEFADRFGPPPDAVLQL